MSMEWIKEENRRREQEEQKDIGTAHLYDIVHEQTEEIAQLRAENERLRALVEEAYREGFDEGKDGGWIVGPSVPWKSSEARAALDAQPAPGKEGENE